MPVVSSSPPSTVPAASPSTGPERTENTSNRQNVSGAPNKGKAPRSKKPAKEKTKELLNVELFPLGSFTPVMWRDAHRLMMWWMSLETPGAVKTALQILERCVRELKFVTTANLEDTIASKHGSWVTADNLLDRLIKSWVPAAR
jgi:hypothetical protein